MEKTEISKRIKIAVFAVAATFAVSFLAYQLVWKAFFDSSGYESVMRETELRLKYDFQSCSSFAACSSGFFYSTKDGIRFIDSGGAEKMSHTFTFLSPVLISEGNYAAVYDLKGKTLYVYSETGLVYNKTFDNNILAVSMNAKGYTSVITQGKDLYEILLFNDRGIGLQKYSYSDSYSYPVCSDISDDGRILAVVFWDFGGIEVSSKIVFIYANQTEYINYKDGIFGSILGDSGEYVGMIRFMDGNALLTVSDRGLSLVDAAAGVSRKWTRALSNKLDHIAFFGSSGFAIALGAPVLNASAEPQGLVEFFDLSLKKTGEFMSPDGSVTSLSAGFGAAIIESSKKLAAVTKNGKELWSYNCAQDIRQVIFVENSSSILIASNNEAILYKLTKNKNTGEAAE